MKVLNFLFFILFIVMASNVNFAKEIDDEYGSETQVETFATEDEDIVKKKFNYNETYGPTPIFSIGGGLSMNPGGYSFCLLYTSPSPRDATLSRMPSSA